MRDQERIAYFEDINGRKPTPREFMEAKEKLSFLDKSSENKRVFYAKLFFTICLFLAVCIGFYWLGQKDKISSGHSTNQVSSAERISGQRSENQEILDKIIDKSYPKYYALYDINRNGDLEFLIEDEDGYYQIYNKDSELLFETENSNDKLYILADRPRNSPKGEILFPIAVLSSLDSGYQLTLYAYRDDSLEEAIIYSYSSESSGGGVNGKGPFTGLGGTGSNLDIKDMIDKELDKSIMLDWHDISEPVVD